MPTYLYLLLMISITGCGSPEQLKEKQLKAYVNSADSGLTLEREVNDLTIKIQYRPNDLVVAQELRAKQGPTLADLNEARKKYGSVQYWVMSLSEHGEEPLNKIKGDPAHFNEVLQNLSFKMDQFVHLTTEDLDTIPLIDFMYSRTFGSSSANSVLLAFPSERITGKGDLYMHLSDLGFGTGKQRFQFLAEDLERVPSLIYDDLEGQRYAKNDE